MCKQPRVMRRGEKHVDDASAQEGDSGKYQGKRPVEPSLSVHSTSKKVVAQSSGQVGVSGASGSKAPPVFSARPLPGGSISTDSPFPSLSSVPKPALPMPLQGDMGMALVRHFQVVLPNYFLNQYKFYFLTLGFFLS